LHFIDLEEIKENQKPVYTHCPSVFLCTCWSISGLITLMISWSSHDLLLLWPTLFGFGQKFWTCLIGWAGFSSTSSICTLFMYASVLFM